MVLCNRVPVLFLGGVGLCVCVLLCLFALFSFPLTGILTLGICLSGSHLQGGVWQRQQGWGA